MASHVGAAVIGELAGRAVSKLLTTLGTSRSGVDEKLRRLKMLVIKLRSTVEVSEKLGTETASLLEWRDKLKEAAAEGQQVLLSFERRATLEADTGTEAAKVNQGASTSGAMSVTRNAFQGMARGVRNAAALWLAGDEGAEDLNSTVDRLEKVWADIDEFIRLLQAEASTVKAVHRPNKRKRKQVGTELERAEIGELTQRVLPGPFRRELVRVAGNGTPGRFCCYFDEQEEDDVDGDDINKKIAESSEHGMSEEPATTSTVHEDTWAKQCARSTAAPMRFDVYGLAEEPAMPAAVKRLNDAVAEIARAVEMADARDLSELECLAEWADVLREAKPPGNAILRIVSDAKARKQAEEGHEEDLLRSAVEGMENLALDVGWFTSLVSLCTPI